MMKINKAFTLAEVLITLGIIGVVAAMTLPTLVQHYKKQEASARLKKFYSMMSQAIKLSEAENGEVDYWDKAAEVYIETEDGGKKQDPLANSEGSKAFFMKYIAPYIKYTSTDKMEATENEEDMKDYEFKVNFADGSTVKVHNGGCVDFIYDINGDKKPNATGYDIFYFMLCTNPETRNEYTLRNQTFTGYWPRKAQDKATALAKCKTERAYCSTLLMYDGWEFTNDYPYKL